MSSLVTMVTKVKSENLGISCVKKLQKIIYPKVCYFMEDSKNNGYHGNQGEI